MIYTIILDMEINKEEFRNVFTMTAKGQAEVLDKVVDIMNYLGGNLVRLNVDKRSEDRLTTNEQEIEK
jgi:hypothetical protein